MRVLASIPVVVSVLLLGSLADLGREGRTSFALGVCSATIGYLVGDWLESLIDRRHPADVPLMSSNQQTRD